jgi:hypothetical protein
MLWLPQARRDPKGRILNWTEKTDPKGCLHTTETSGWPGYDGWTVHPHATVMPHAGRMVEIEQNIPFDQAGFSLKNLAGGVQTNTDYVFQFELIGTCARNGPGYYWPDADEPVLLSLYDDLIAPVSKAFGIPLKAPTFQAYPASFGPVSGTNNVRMSGSKFDAYSGWLGHQHVPENVHGDPGAFPWVRMIKLVEDRDMALSPEDRVWLQTVVDKRADLIEANLNAGVRRAVEQVWEESKIVRNQPLDGVPEGDPWTPAGAVSNIEKDVDLLGRGIAQILAALKAPEPPPAA